MLDIDLDRWDDPDYTLRADEIAVVVELLNALVRQMRQKKKRALFFSNSYPSEAEKLRKVKWNQVPQAV
jgi:hypothetical protein